MHGAQRGDRVDGAGDIVEADQRDIVGHVQLAPVQRQRGAEGHLVVGGEDGGVGLAAVEQPLHRHAAAFLVELARQHQAGVEGQAGGFQRGAVAAQALAGVGVAGVARDEGDAPVAQREQVVGGQSRALEVVECQRVQARRLQAAARHHHRQALRVGRQRCVRQAPGEHDDAVDAARTQHLDAARFLRHAPVAADEQRAVAGARELFLDAAQRAAEEGAVDGLRHHAHAQRAPAGQPARHRVGHEAQLRDGLVDGPALVVADHRGAVEDARDRARRHARGLRHHLQRHLAGIARGRRGAAAGRPVGLGVHARAPLVLRAAV